MNKVHFSTLLFVGAFAVACANASAQVKAGPVKVAESEEERSFAADAPTYVSEAVYELQWSPVRQQDILWRKRVHRSLNVAESANKVFGRFFR